MVLGVIALGACGGSDTETVTETETVTVASGSAEAVSGADARVGDTLSSSDPETGEQVEIQIVSYKKGATPDDAGTAQSILESESKSTSDTEWIRLRVSARNTGEGPITLLGEGFQAIDTEDQRYEGISLDPGGIFEPDAAGETLDPSERIQGFIAVLVPRRADITRIRYSSIVGTGAVDWQVTP